MNEIKQQDIEKYCSFYVSNVHLSVMILPYINNELNNDIEITAIFEKIDIDEIKKLINKLNLKNSKEILKINWIKTNDEKYSRKFLEKYLSEEKKNTIIIGGCQSYIKKVNLQIDEMLCKSKLGYKIEKIVDCYNIEEKIDNIKDITKKYNGIINTINCINAG